MGNTCCHPKDTIEHVQQTPNGPVVTTKYVDRTIHPELLQQIHSPQGFQNWQPSQSYMQQQQVLSGSRIY